MLLPLLMMIAAPDAQDGDKLAEPVAVAPSQIRYAPSRALVSATAEGVAGLPAAPVSISFECLVDAHFGEAQHCIALGGAAKPAATRAEFDRRAAAWKPTPIEGIALERIRATRLNPLTDAPYDAAHPILIPMLFTQTVSVGDVVKLGPPTAVMEARDVEYDERPDGVLLTSYYPPRALAAGIEVRMTATCRVQPDRTLFCRNARPASPDSRIDAPMAREFALATYQVLAAVRLMPLTKAGDPVVGREVEMRIAFAAGG
ncbi:hypothetical protein OF829_04400 [Sphingomonas sp. LB-2]|uniref:hypothetical protein n=1 Tax=Sphingomonas caeni TaxID=2984949 RepID=UPI002231AB73|nr:hypothetical protein [Sphingomonas caeni]MCW3846468.1 hypothetical protein [Sphingomonas caeni]